jgi:hypothetical protein
MQDNLMDANKLEKLKEINYTINKNCGLCRYAKLSEDGWGVCINNCYMHIKHNSMMELSINRYGSCDQFELSDPAQDQLGTYNQFLDRNKEQPKRQFELED